MEKSIQNLNIIYSHRTRGKDVEAVHIRGISDALRRMGHHVDIISVPGTDVYESIERADTSVKRIQLWSLVSKYTPQIIFELLEICYNLILFKNLKKALKVKRVDLIYERYALNTFATTLIGKKLGIPVILEINDATGIVRVRKHKMEFLSKMIEAWVFKNASALITISSEFERILINRGLTKNKVSYVPNAVDPDIFNPKLYDNSIKDKYELNNKLVVGFVGAFALWHGVDLILQLAPLLIKKIKNVHFLLVGDGVSLQHIKDQVNSMGLMNEFSFVGKVESLDIPCYLKAMDIGLIPNSNNYGSPMKLLEYMSMGVIPVAPKLPPMKDVVEDEVSGLLFNPGDAKDMGKQILKIFSDDDLRKILSVNARTQVLKKHLWQHNAQHIINVYRQLNVYC